MTIEYTSVNLDNFGETYFFYGVPRRELLDLLYDLKIPCTKRNIEIALNSIYNKILTYEYDDGSIDKNAIEEAKENGDFNE